MEKTNLCGAQYERAIAEHGVAQELHQQSPGRFRADLKTREVNGVVLYCDNFSQSYITYLPPPPNCIGIVTATSPRGALTANGKQLGSGGLVVSPPWDGVDLIVPSDTSADSLTIPEKRFFAIAESISPGLDAVDRLSVVHSKTAQLQRLRIHTRRLAQAPITSPDQADFDNLIAEWIAWLGQSDDTFEQRESLRRQRRAHIARRARGYFVEHYAQPLRMEDACSEIGVGLRTLQRCFTNYFQMSPYRYLKVLRLNKARHVLLQHDPSTSSVTRIATDNGFHHLGRFAVEYRDLFGETPRDTLAAAPEAMAA